MNIVLAFRLNPWWMVGVKGRRTKNQEVKEEKEVLLRLLRKIILGLIYCSVTSNQVFADYHNNHTAIRVQRIWQRGRKQWWNKWKKHKIAENWTNMKLTRTSFPPHLWYIYRDVKMIATFSCVFPLWLQLHDFPFRQTAPLWNTECRELHWLHIKGEYWLLLQQAFLLQRLDDNLQ
jgi:hypothetical protein